MKNILFLIAITFISICFGFERLLPYTERHNNRAAEHSENITYQSVSRDEDELISYIQGLVDSNQLPGVAVAIVKEDNIVWDHYFGFSNIDESIYVDQHTMYSLASVSKTVTATALMQLWEDGMFELEDDIDEYLAFNVNHPDYPFTPITFNMLLSHTSGIKDRWSAMPYYDGDSELELGYYLEQYLTVGGEFYSSDACFTNSEPGTAYNYTNIGAALIGLLVESISGQAFNEYCNDYIFTPLDMEDTAWFLHEVDNLDQLAFPYVLSGGSGDSCYDIGCGIYDQSNPCFCDSECVYYDDCCFDYDDVCGEDGTGSSDDSIGLEALNHYGYSDYPSGQLRTSALDLSKFLSANMNHGSYFDTQILDPETIELIRSAPYPDVDPQQGHIWYYKNQSSRTLFGHNGGDLGSLTEMFSDLSQMIGVIVLCNTSSYGTVIEIENALFDFAEENDFFISGDVNGDSSVDILDIVQLVNLILSNNYSQIADMNSDGVLNVMDIVLLVSAVLE